MHSCGFELVSHWYCLVRFLSLITYVVLPISDPVLSTGLVLEVRTLKFREFFMVHRKMEAWLDFLERGVEALTRLKEEDQNILEGLS